MGYKVIKNDDYLAHYGVKGMKWGKHKKATYNDVIKTSRDAGRAQTASITSIKDYEDKDAAYQRSIRLPSGGGSARPKYRPADDTRDKELQDAARHRAEQRNNKLLSERDSAFKKSAEKSYEADKAIETANKTKQNYYDNYTAKANKYEQERAVTKEKQALDAARVNASRDVGRAQSKLAASKSVSDTVTAVSAQASAEKTLSKVDSDISKYNADTKAKVDKITSEKKTASQIANDVVEKAKSKIKKLLGIR